MYLFLFHSVFLLGLTAFATRHLYARSLDRFLAVGVIAWGNIVVTCLLLASLQLLGSSAWFLRTSLSIAAATWFLCRRFQPAKQRDIITPVVNASPLSPKLVTLLILTLIPLVYVSIRIAATYVPNNYDSLTYHLPRAMLYMGQGTLGHFDTGNDRQIFFPFNYNLLQLFSLIYSPPLQVLNFLNLATWGVSGVAVFRLARQAGSAVNHALIATWLALTSTQILGQATATTNDLPTAAGLLCCLVFVLRWREGRLERDALLAGLAGGLTLGSKLTVVFFGPVAGLIVLTLAWQHWRRGQIRGFISGLRAWIAPGLLFLLMASPFALINLAEKGQWMTQTYDYTLNRPFSTTSVVQTSEAYLTQLVVEPVHRFTFDLAFTQKLNVWAEQSLFTNWNPQYAFSPFYLFPPDLNEDHVWFGFVGPVFLLCALFCLWRWRHMPAPMVWLAGLGVGWMATYFTLNKWSLYNQRYMVLAILVMSPCLAACLGSGSKRPWSRRSWLVLLTLLITSSLWLAGIYLFKNTSRPYAPLWAGEQAPAALPKLPSLLARRMQEQPRINIDSTDGNERTFLFMAQGKNQRFIASKRIQPDYYHVFSEWGYPRKVAYSNIEQKSSFTIVPIPTKRTAGVEFLGTMGRSDLALDYYGLMPHPESVTPTDGNRNLLVEFHYGPREPNRYAHMRIRVAGLNDADQAKLSVGIEYEDGTTATLATFTRSGEAPVPVTKPFRRFFMRAVDANTGDKIGGTDLPYRFRRLPPEIDTPDDPSLILADELIIPQPQTLIPTEGLSAPEGPYPQWDLPLFRWAKSPVVRLEIPTTADMARLEFIFSVRLEARDHAQLDVIFNGELVQGFTLTGSSNWFDHTTALKPRPDKNILEIRNVVVDDEPDWLDYLDRYPDVKNYVVNQGIPLEQGAKEHYESFGKNETRTLHHRRRTVTLPDKEQLYYLFRSLRINGYHHP